MSMISAKIKRTIKKLGDSPAAFCTFVSVIMILYVESASRHDFFGGFTQTCDIIKRNGIS